jgi:hypothetical protein
LARHGRLVAVLVIALALLGGFYAPAQARLPSRAVWMSDVSEAMEGSIPWLEQRVDRGGRRLAANFDIDNTSIASHYDPGDPVPQVLEFAQRARELGVSLLFNTGRVNRSDLRASTLRQLDRNGYEVAELCMREQGESKAAGKQRCRRQFVADGYTIIANVGNLPTDFVGGDYERAFRLPHYDEELN